MLHSWKLITPTDQNNLLHTEIKERSWTLKIWSNPAVAGSSVKTLLQLDSESEKVVCIKGNLNSEKWKFDPAKQLQKGTHLAREGQITLGLGGADSPTEICLIEKLMPYTNWIIMMLLISRRESLQCCWYFGESHSDVIDDTGGDNASVATDWDG